MKLRPGVFSARSSMAFSRRASRAAASKAVTLIGVRPAGWLRPPAVTSTAFSSAWPSVPSPPVAVANARASAPAQIKPWPLLPILPEQT